MELGVVERALGWEATLSKGGSTSLSLCFFIQIPRISAKVS